jgi:CheY-like chemotaxis protein
MNDRPTSLASPAQRALRRLLSAAFDDPDRATAAVARSLAIARRDALPQDADEMLEFAREYVLPVVTDDLGPRLAAALIHDFEEELVAERSTQIPSEPNIPSSAFPSQPRGTPASARTPAASSAKMPVAPVSTPMGDRPSATGARAKVRAAVLLIDADRFGRAPLARSLVSGGCDVTAVETLADATEALQGSEPIDIVMLDADHHALDALLRAVAAARPNAAVIARADRVASANSKMLASGIHDFAVRPKSALPKELIELIARFATR